jgi:hypothetical protein
MELVAVLVLFVVLALVFTGAVAVILLVLGMVRGADSARVVGIRGLSAAETDWDDEEISARFHQ